MPRFSANIGLLWPDRPLLERIDAAARAGFRAIEMHWPYEVPAAEVAARCRRQGLRILGINTSRGDFERGERGLGAQPGREAAFLEDFERVRQYGRACGASAIHVMVGNLPAEGYEAGRRTLLANLAAAVQRVADEDLTLLLEPLNPRDNPGYFYSTVEQAAAIVRELASPRVKLQFDAYHVALTEGDVLGKLERYLPMIGHVQIAAVPNRAEPDEGELDYKTVFRALDALGYAGWVGCEYHPRGETDAGLAWTAALGIDLSRVEPPNTAA